MIDKSLLDDLAKRVSEGIPDGFKFLQEDLEKNIRTALEAGLSHLDLVTREEFDLQTAVLARTREKLEQLEKIVAQLESDSN
jgi:BMFP domain-containing protein YqiC